LWSDYTLSQQPGIPPLTISIGGGTAIWDMNSSGLQTWRFVIGAVPDPPIRTINVDGFIGGAYFSPISATYQNSGTYAGKYIANLQGLGPLQTGTSGMQINVVIS
jgi:hypothetical protein